MHSAYSLLVGALLWLVSAPGRAQLPVLEWEAAPGCPDVQAVRDALQRAVEPAQLARVRAVRASVERTDNQYRPELELQTDSGSQRSERFAELCSTFVDLLVLELGLWAAPHETPQQPGADSGVPTAWGVRLTGIVGSGPTPAPAPGVALALALARRRLRLELAAIYAFPQTVHYSAPQQIGARFDLLGGETRGCYALPARRVEVPLCAGAELGALHGSAIGVDQTSRSELWAALLVASALRIPIAGPLSAWLELGAWLALRRPSFGVHNLPVLFQPAQAGARGGVGLALRFD